MSRHLSLLTLVAVCAFDSTGTSRCSAAEAPESATYGWRGNWTGRFPEATPPVRWNRTAKGVLAGLTYQAARPGEPSAQESQPIECGLVRDWLVIGPFPVEDSVEDFDVDQLASEPQVQPDDGDAVGGLTWKHLFVDKPPDYERWGTTELDWVDLAEVVGYKPNQVAYAHTYLHCQRPGKVELVVDHAHGMKAWVNGKQVYANPQRGMGLGSYVGISRQKRDLTCAHSPRFEIELGQGWNRLLIKLSTYNRQGWRSQKFAMRLLDEAPVEYEEENIVWMTELPERTNAVPVVVGDRIFTVAEPDELLCLDKHSGRILWRRLNGLYEATSPEYRQAHPVFAEKIDPLAQRLHETTDPERSLALRREIRELLVGLDSKKYKMKWDGHLADHFGIVGFTTTPVSDGRHVFAFLGQGVVACYDLDGNRKWITRLEADEIAYSCTPALIGGVLAVVFGGTHGLDARTGAILWHQPEVTSISSLIPARIRNVDVVCTKAGQVLRASDGRLLWSNPHMREGDTGWAAPVVIDEVMYLPWIGIGSLLVADFRKVTGEPWEPAVRLIPVDADHRRPDGEWLDRWTAGSPLIHEGIYYNIDQYGVFYAVDLESGATLYKHDVGFDELHHYNAIGVGAGPALGGRYIYVVDNQGDCVVLEPGPAYRPVAVNHIHTSIRRHWPIPPQEILSNGAPVFDGARMYLRGERYLYCIGGTR